MPKEYKTELIAIRVTKAKKAYLEQHFGSMLPVLIRNYLDQMIASAVVGIYERDIVKLKQLLNEKDGILTEDNSKE